MTDYSVRFRCVSLNQRSEQCSRRARKAYDGIWLCWQHYTMVSYSLHYQNSDDAVALWTALGLTDRALRKQFLP